MKKIISELRYWSQLFYFPIYWLSFLFPRNPKIWVCGSTFGNRFADNPRYFYLYLAQNQPGVTPVWISHKKELVTLLQENGYKAYLHNSLRGIWYCLRGGVYLYDNYPKDISQWLSGGAMKVNLWHGISLKKIQMDNIFDTIRHPKTKLSKLRWALRRFTDEKPNHYILSVSKYWADICASAFQTTHVFSGGYPRTDILCSDQITNIFTAKEQESIADIASCSHKKIILYMPTFRESEIEFFNVISLPAFQQFLESNNLVFCVKLHCKSKLRKEFEAIQGNHILVIHPDTDPNIYFAQSDLMITDYSSAYFDYLVLYKPVIFFDYDLTEYLSHSREMYFDYNEFTPNPKVKTQDELESMILACLNGNYPWESDPSRKKVYDYIYDYPVGTACDNLYHDICAVKTGRNKRGL